MSNEFYDDETMITLRGYGLEMSVVDDFEDAAYVLYVKFDNYKVETIQLSDMFHWNIAADKIIKHHSRQIERGNVESVSIDVFDVSRNQIVDSFEAGEE